MKLWFENFPHYWLKQNNFIVDVLHTKTNIEITSENPDLVVFSDFGDINALNKYKCKKCFYTLENIHFVVLNQSNINYFDSKSIIKEDPLLAPIKYPFEYYLKYADFSLLFYETNAKNIEVPVWLALLPVKTKNLKNYYDDRNHYKILTEKRTAFNKKEYCSFICSNKFVGDDIDYWAENISPRYKLFDELNKKQFIHSGGKYKNNIGRPVKNKCDYLKKFVFNLAFENSYHHYYTSEKLVEPFFSSCIPVYWGGERCFDYMRKDLVVYANNKNSDEIHEEMLEIYNDKYKIKYMTTEPVIDKYPIEYTPKYIAEQILDRTFYTT